MDAEMESACDGVGGILLPETTKKVTDLGMILVLFQFALVLLVLDTHSS